MNLGWVLGIIHAHPDPSSSFAFFAGSLGVIIVAVSRGLLEVCASATAGGVALAPVSLSLHFC